MLKKVESGPVSDAAFKGLKIAFGVSAVLAVILITLFAVVPAIAEIFNASVDGVLLVIDTSFDAVADSIKGRAEIDLDVYSAQAFNSIDSEQVSAQTNSSNGVIGPWIMPVLLLGIPSVVILAKLVSKYKQWQARRSVR